MDKKPLIVANWKMNPTSSKEVEHLMGALKSEIKKNQSVEIVICPPFIYLKNLLASSSGKFVFGAQDCFWEQKGAFTGEISPSMLKELGCQYIIVGHSERRKYFQETDEIVSRKLKAVLKARLKPILCIGEETRDSFDSDGKPLNEMSLVVGEQLEKDLSGITSIRIGEIVIAYEPVWAIGTGVPCQGDDAMKAALFIKKILTKLYSRSIAEKTKIIYGGSVTSQNAADYVKGARMDGLLVGGASLNASEFKRIISVVSQ